MDKMRIQHDRLPDLIVQSLTDRDAVLWIGAGIGSDEREVELLRRMICLPWRMVLCESTNAVLAESLEKASQADDRLNRKRGFVHLVASDPEEVELPPRSLPVFFLNGRENASGTGDSCNRPRRAMERRRLNMINLLQRSNPRVLLALSSGADHPLDDLIELWDEGLRPLLVIQSSASEDAHRLDHWLTQKSSPPAIDHCVGPFVQSASDLLDRSLAVLSEDRWVIRLRLPTGEKRELDVTECELIEQPLLDRYEILQVRDLVPLVADDLSSEEFNSFFDQSKKSWRPFAAGVPWHRSKYPRQDLLRLLREVETGGPEQNRIAVIACQSGAGGTTLARSLAFEAAREGYPTLVAKQAKFQPNPTELATFLYRVRQFALSTPAEDSGASPDDDSASETPWLLVYDVQHWEGRRTEIQGFVKALSRSGRPAVVLVVTDEDIGDELQKASNKSILDKLGHELSERDVLALGAHLNKFLRRFGREKSESEWRSFWESHSPGGMGNSIASFWIALEFWLKGQFDLSESIQQWIMRQFRETEIRADERRLVLEIAALSIERLPYPEALLPRAPEGTYPYSSSLHDIRSEIPSLALVYSRQPSPQWAMAHDLLGRYLIKSVFYDRSMLAALGLDSVEDPTMFRLLLLRRVATRKEMGQKQFAHIAEEFAVHILKLGTDGNLEFAPFWREAIGILDDMPRAVWDTSRSFNHHVAISRRRVATSDDLFQLTLDEKREQLAKAIEHLEYALDKIRESNVDQESDLNLLNSLSLAYQNLADVEREWGAPEGRLAELGKKATDAARRAQEENPTNSYVLETFARNLLQNGRLYPEQATVCAAEALGHIYQAMSLDQSLLRESSLARHANEALSMLRSPLAMSQIDKVCSTGNPLGYLARAWLVLTKDVGQITKEYLSSLPKDRIEAALAVVDGAQERANFFLLRFRYDLITISQPRDFEVQLGLLDDLKGTGHSVPLQLQLERAILLHQRNRHHEANIEFRRIREELRVKDVYVDVPHRLRWLLTPDGKQRICHARVSETRNYRSIAKVSELDNAEVPFIPQDFGKSQMPAGYSFTCSISFGAKGPFIKSPVSHEDKK